ncbi:MAG: hypothetical protein NZL89_06670 [Leptospiraceae bacterium]|nr:hypothetical protein [Leptospiraceae bacterium]
MPIAEHAGAREEFTNIRVNREGRWFTGDREIVNWKVISHFKQNLFRDEKGIYIYQEFRQFSEKGYITVEGPLLAVFRVDKDKLTFDSLDTLPVATAQVVQNTEDDALYVFYPRLGCYASVPAAVAPDFAELLAEDEGLVLFCGRPVPRIRIEQWS